MAWVAARWYSRLRDRRSVAVARSVRVEWDLGDPERASLRVDEGVVSPQGESPPKGGVATLPTTFSGVACCGSCPRSLRDLRVGL